MHKLALGIMIIIFAADLGAKEIPWNGHDDIIGALKLITTKRENTFVDLAEEFNFGYSEMVSANPEIDAWLPEANKLLVLPGRHILPAGDRVGVVINLAEYRLYYFNRKRQIVFTYPIGIGISEAPTPLVSAKIVSKTKDPTWYPPAGVRERHLAEGHILPRFVPAGPENPLGPYALKLSAEGYLIHGTNKQIGIGMQVSSGCIRMYNHDIAEFTEIIDLGANVRIVNEPVKLAVSRGRLFVEIHANEDTDKSTLEQRFFSKLAELENTQTLEGANQYFLLNPEFLESSLAEISGIPVMVGEALPATVELNVELSNAPSFEGALE